MLLSVGERISTALLGIALDELGHRAVSFTGSQSGIITNTRHTRARIIEVRPFRLMDELDAGSVVIVAGYQGVSYSREITTLGRGGTDTTAVALAAALGAEYCEICSDVDGVYTADPRLVLNAQRLDALDHDEMVALARSGARVLNQDCVEYASRHGVAIFAKSSFGPRDDKGTVIRTNPTRERTPVTGLAHRSSVAEISIGPGARMSDLFESMSATGVFPQTLSGGDGRGIHLLVPLEDAHRFDAFETRLREAFGEGVQIRCDRGSVSIVGKGLGEEPTLLRQVIATTESLGVRDPGVHIGPLTLTLLVPENQVTDVLQSLHDALMANTTNH